MADDNWLDRLDRMFRDRGVTNFTARELCLMRKIPTGPALARPPESLWKHLVNVAVLAQAVRDEYGLPLAVSSGYRPADYNKAVGGARRSAHIKAGAVDLNVLSKHQDSEHRARLNRATAKVFTEHPLARGFGVYRGGRVHVDVVGRKRFWGRAKEWLRV